MVNIDAIINTLINKSLIPEQVKVERLNSGAADDILYLLFVDKKPVFVVKIDTERVIKATQHFLTTYSNTELLQKILYTDPHYQYIVFYYIAGETHFNRGLKIDWMKILIDQLFNYYIKVDETMPWGRINGASHNSWSDFNHNRLSYAQQNIGSILLAEDHKRIECLVNKLNQYSHLEEKYYLHGDVGVHNFVYLNKKIRGVLDPLPLIGPKVYDFTYAFCSSPDNLDMDTLLTLFELWNHEGKYTEARLVDEFVFQLYTQIGICIKAHPHELRQYLKIWEQYKNYLPNG